MGLIVLAALKTISETVLVVPTQSTYASRPLWTCPKCKREFVTRNMPHSCGRYSVAQFLSGKNAAAISLFERFSDLAHECGPLKLAPAKPRIGFQVRMI